MFRIELSCPMAIFNIAVPEVMVARADGLIE
jgi:hypothetical protein